MGDTFVCSEDVLHTFGKTSIFWTFSKPGCGRSCDGASRTRRSSFFFSLLRNPVRFCSSGVSNASICWMDLLGPRFLSTLDPGGSPCTAGQGFLDLGLFFVFLMGIERLAHVSDSF